MTSKKTKLTDQQVEVFQQEVVEEMRRMIRAAKVMMPGLRFTKNPSNPTADIEVMKREAINDFVHTKLEVIAYTDEYLTYAKKLRRVQIQLLVLPLDWRDFGSIANMNQGIKRNMYIYVEGLTDPLVKGHGPDHYEMKGKAVKWSETRY